MKKSHNRTSVELKPADGTVTAEAPVSHNRTSVELKHLHRSGS